VIICPNDSIALSNEQLKPVRNIIASFFVLIGRQPSMLNDTDWSGLDRSDSREAAFVTAAFLSTGNLCLNTTFASASELVGT
jgi:hypothetical protein